MKPTTPMVQLEQWKKTNALKIEPVNQSKIGSVKDSAKLKFEPCENPQSESHSEPKKKYQGKLSFNPLAFKLAQLTRQFKLIQDSNQKCFEVYPDDFHHKLKFRAELVDVSERLKAGGKLLNHLAKMQGVTLTRDNQGILRDFNQANGYLLTKFNELIEQIDKLNLERVENEKLQGAKDE